MNLTKRINKKTNANFNEKTTKTKKNHKLYCKVDSNSEKFSWEKKDLSQGKFLRKRIWKILGYSNHK